MELGEKKTVKRAEGAMLADRNAVSLENAAVGRACKALLSCVAIATAFLIGVSASDGSWAGAHAESGYVDKIWKAMKAGRGFDSALEEVGAMVLSKERIPKWMLDEILDEEWLNGAISSKDQQVIWMTRTGALSDVRAETASALESKGWSTVASTTEENPIATYVKTEGECRWILAEYAQSGKETVAVLRIQRN